MLQINSQDPAKLLTAIRLAIKNNKLPTWGVDDEGDFFHDTAQWAQRGWLRPSPPTANQLQLKYVGTHAVLHGRFIEMLLIHFPGHFTFAAATP